MEEVHFIKCEPKWPSDTEESSNFEADTEPPYDDPVENKVEACLMPDDPSDDGNSSKSIKEEFLPQDVKEEPNTDDVDSGTLPDGDLTLVEVLNILEELYEGVSNIYTEPPDATVHSDEDSAEEDEGDLVDSLTRQQLRVLIKLIYSHEDEKQCYDHPEEDFPTRKRPRKMPQVTSTWTKDDLQTEFSQFPEPDYSSLKDKSATDIFECFLDEDIVQLLCSEATRYALFKNEADPKITPQEMRAFIGILLFSAYYRVPGFKMMWESDPDVRNKMVCSAMCLDRFMHIMKYIHFADNSSVNEKDKLWKLRPLINKVQEKCIINFRAEEHLSYDKYMIPYYESHNCWEFIRKQHFRFGYKVWCLNTVDGYLVSFEIDQNKSPCANEEYELDFGKAAAPLVTMIDRLPDVIQKMPLKLYFNSYVTGFNLVNHLRARGFGCTGTILENQIPKGCPLPTTKEMKKMDRGTYEYAQSKEGGLIIARWVNNAIVSVVSSCHGVNPVTNVDRYRYSQTEKEKVQVPRPDLFGKYSRYKGGTEQMGRNVDLYRIGARGKKWWWGIFTWLIDIMAHNAWRLAKKSGMQISLLDFRTEIVVTYLTRYKNLPRTGGHPPTSRDSTIDIRMQYLSHPTIIDGNDVNSLESTEESSNDSQNREDLSATHLGLDSSEVGEVTRYKHEKAFPCKECELVCRSRSALAKHIVLHTGLRPYVCKFCSKSFTRKDSLNTHEMRHTGVKPYVCTTCGKAFVNSVALNRHIRIHTGEKKFICKICNKSYSQWSGLKLHELAHSGEKAHACPSCGKAFVSKGALKKHMPMHTNEKSHSCTLCGKSYAHRFTLQEHMLKHIGGRILKCKHCDKSYTSRAGLAFHMRMHTGEMLHNCTSCTKSFTTRTLLQRHMLSHNGGKPHVCPSCGNAYALKSSLKRHLSTHGDVDACSLKGPNI